MDSSPPLVGVNGTAPEGAGTGEAPVTWVPAVAVIMAGGNIRAEEYEESATASDEAGSVRER